MSRRRRSTAERGVALVAVLLLVAGLIAIATAVVTLSAAQRRSAQRTEEAEQRRAVLDSALRVAIAEIAFPKLEGPFWRPRQPRTLPIGEVRVEVTLERESGRIDLNMADDKYLVAALVKAGLAEARAREGAARIRDWTDADDEVREDGAEQGQYQAAALSHGPRNGPFENVEELRQVLGLGGLGDEALDAFTVYSQQTEPFASEAPERVREAIDWIAKAAGEGGAAALPAPVVADGPGSLSYAGSVVRLRACEARVRAASCRIVVVRFTGGAQQPFQIFRWR